jgi:hypothetical protein
MIHAHPGIDIVLVCTGDARVALNSNGKAILSEAVRISLHDAVLNVAVVWKDIGGRF